MKKRILIADDDERMIRFIIRTLGDAADAVAICGDGAEVLSAYEEKLPDVVLMDIQMPRLDGITATKKLKAIFPLARVLILTSFDSRSLRRAADEAGASGYCLKDDLLELPILIEKLCTPKDINCSR